LTVAGFLAGVDGMRYNRALLVCEFEVMKIELIHFEVGVVVRVMVFVVLSIFDRLL
jgi:hypothetical protein